MKGVIALFVILLCVSAAAAQPVNLTSYTNCWPDNKILYSHQVTSTNGLVQTVDENKTCPNGCVMNEPDCNPDPFMIDMYIIGILLGFIIIILLIVLLVRKA